MVLLLCLSGAASAAISSYQFDTPEEDARFNKLSEELRCLVCQNQNLADSNADLARDLRREIHDMIIAGKSDQEIIKFLTDRYGDFVLYDPPVKTITLLLWGGPFILIVIGAITLIVLVRRRGGSTDEAPLSAEEQARLDQLTHGHEGEGQ